MISEKVLSSIKSYYPTVQVAFKNESKLMWIIGKLMFWNKDFMTKYATTLGDTIYFPTKSYLNSRSVSSVITLLHETIHVHDSHKENKFLFSFLYGLPQSLIILLPILFFISWKIALPLFLLALPIPAYFRMVAERRAYMVSLYVIYSLNKKNNYNINLTIQKDDFISQFKDSSYYFMWPFSSIDKQFDDALAKINAGERPFDDKEVFDMLDNILNEA